MPPTLPTSTGTTGSRHFSTADIWRLTWPQALMMFFQFLIGFTDVWVAGHIGSEVQAVLGIVTQCQFVLLIVGMAMANGSIAAISQSLGANLERRALRYSGLVLKYGLMFSAVVVLGSIFLRHPILVLLQVPESILPLAERFWLIFLAVIPANYLLALTSATFRARRLVFIPLASTSIACVVNAFASTGFGLGYWGLPALGAEGIAAATFVSITAASFFNLYMAVRLKVITRASFTTWRWEKNALPFIAKVAVPGGGMQIFWQLGYVVLFGVTSSLPLDNVNALAGMTAGMRVESILFLPAFAFNMTGSMLVGHCLGAGDKVEAKRLGWRILLIGCSCMSTAALLLWPWVGHIAAFIAPDPAAQVHALEYLRYNLMGTPFSVASLVLGGIMTGAGATIYTFFVFSSAIWLVRLPMAWFLGHYLMWGSSGIFFAMFLSQVFQSGTILAIFHRCDWTRFAMTARRRKATIQHTPLKEGTRHV